MKGLSKGGASFYRNTKEGTMLKLTNKIALIILIFVTVTLAEDIYYIKQIQNTYAKDGKVLHSQNIEQYVGKDTVKVINSLGTLIVTKNSFKTFLHKPKKCLVKNYPKMKEYFRKLDKTVANFEISDTKESLKIGKFPTKKYLTSVLIDSVKVKSEVYIAHNLDIPFEVLYRQILLIGSENIPNLTKMIAKMKEIGGIKIEEKILASNTGTIIKEIKKIKKFPGIFNDLKGYKIVKE